MFTGTRAFLSRSTGWAIYVDRLSAVKKTQVLRSRNQCKPWPFLSDSVPKTPARPRLVIFPSRTTRFLHQYEMYFTAPADVSGDFTISITAQLGVGATGADWKVDLFSFLPVDSQTWQPVGDLTDGKLQTLTKHSMTAIFCVLGRFFAYYVTAFVWVSIDLQTGLV